MALVLVLLPLVIFEEKLIYFPARDPAGSFDPAQMGLAGAREVETQAEDGVRLHAWWAPAEPERAVVLFLHGNAGNLTHRSDHVRLLREIGCSTLLLDYRGYGKSEGSPSERGLAKDARAGHALAFSLGAKPERLVILGESIGAAVALGLALERPCAAVVLVSPFTSIAEMRSRVIPLLPVEWVMRTKHDNIGRVPRLDRPLLVIHGEEDEIVPFGMGRRVFDAAGTALASPPPREFVALPGTGHNDVPDMGGRRYREAIREFVGRHCR